jgi:protein tyrosine phosphatase (PTP) superfamily phosphohydrolase (DUF442 family)
LASAAAAWIAIDRVRWHAVREVIPGEIYRSGQLSASELEDAVERWGVRSVLNLRGAAPGSEWYEAEWEVVKRRGLLHIDLRLSADRPPSRAELAQLVSQLDALEKPLLVHCLGGQDRSGLAEALVILHSGGDLEAARHALRVTFGGFTVSDSPLARYIDQYADWLEEGSASHDADVAKRYALSHYVPEIYGAKLEALSLPRSITADHPYVARFRVANTSPQAWQLSDGRSDRGVHLGLRVERLDPAPIPPCEARADTADASLPPAATTELAMNLPVLREPGRYRFTFDMVNESEAWFAVRGGSQPIVREFEVAARSTPSPPHIADDFVQCDRADTAAP